ncbi:MAG: helix-turn-helix transcriptional regulator [Formosimonas sp.]
MKHQSHQPNQIPAAGMVRWSQIAALMPISKETARKLALKGKFPPPLRFSLRCTMYRCEEIHKWLAAPLDYQAPAI